MKKTTETQCQECGKWMPDDSHLKCQKCQENRKIGKIDKDGGVFFDTPKREGEKR